MKAYLESSYLLLQRKLLVKMQSPVRDKLNRTHLEERPMRSRERPAVDPSRALTQTNSKLCRGGGIW